MPIVVQCGSCSARLPVADRAAGKNLKCPKCQTLIAVPDAADAEVFDVVEDLPPTSSRAKPIAARVVQDAISVDDDELPAKRKSARYEDDGDDRPRLKSNSPKKKSKLLFVLLGAGILGAIGCAGVVVLISMAKQAHQDLAKDGQLSPAIVKPVQTSKDDATKSAPIAKPAPTLPTGWEKFNDPLGEINLYFPGGQPEKNEAATANMNRQAGGNSGDIWAKVNGNLTYMLVRSTLSEADMKGKITEKLLNEAEMGLRGSSLRAKMRTDMTPKDTGDSTRVITVDLLAQRKRLIARITVSGNRLLIITATGGLTSNATDAGMQPFLDNFEVVK